MTTHTDVKSSKNSSSMRAAMTNQLSLTWCPLPQAWDHNWDWWWRRRGCSSSRWRPCSRCQAGWAIPCAIGRGWQSRPARSSACGCPAPRPPGWQSTETSARRHPPGEWGCDRGDGWMVGWRCSSRKDTMRARTRHKQAEVERIAGGQTKRHDQKHGVKTQELWKKWRKMRTIHKSLDK